MFNSYSKEQFIDAVKNSYSIRQVLITLNVRPHGGNYRTVHKYIKLLDLNTDHFKGQGWNKGNTIGPKRPIEDYLSNQQSISSYKLRDRLIKDNIKPHQCEQCKSKEWNNKPIPLELHHIDGNHKNNILSNLQLLCPNCHAQTPNYRNTKSKRKHSAAKLNGYIRPKKQYFCIDCGVRVYRTSKRCKECEYKHRKGKPQKYCKRPLKTQLLTDIEKFNSNKSQIAKQYRVTEASVRKWYKYYNL